MKNFRKQLIELVTIQAPSGQEHKVRNYLQPKLAGLVDSMFVDKAGNLLAEKKCGDGNGATIMLSAHMDSVRNIVKGRKIIEKDGVLTSSKGVLGADDRAGIAIIMAVLRNIDMIDFSGTIKVAFSVEEEIGCVGSGKIDPTWYGDVNLAIVVDRRGNRDIVTGCGSPYNFCSEAVGKFFEDCSGILGMDYKVVGGGVSDAMTFSSEGTHSVNLSAGYRNEHTEQEYMVISDGQDTINLILQAFALVNSFYTTFGEVPVGYTRSTYYSSAGWDEWYEDYDTKYLSAKSSSESYLFNEEVIYESSKGTYGNVSMTDIGGYISIFQDGDKKYSKQEIWMARGDFDGMVNAYLKTKGFPDMSVMLRDKEKITKGKATKAVSKKPISLAKGTNYTTDATGKVLIKV